MFNFTKIGAKSALLLSAFALASCGGSDASSAPDSTPAPAPKAVPSPTPAQTAAAPAEVDPLARGAKVYKKCKSCHSLEQDGKHKVGPNMWALYGSTAGTKEGFAYSKAMKESGIVWDDVTLSGYIENPRKYMPGNRMSYVGLRKAEDREAVLAYIKAQTTAE